MALSFALPCNSEKTSLRVVFGSVSASPCRTDIPCLVNLARSSAGRALPKPQEVAEGDPSPFPAHMVMARNIPPVPESPLGVACPTESFWSNSPEFHSLAWRHPGHPPVAEEPAPSTVHKTIWKKKRFSPTFLPKRPF